MKTATSFTILHQRLNSVLIFFLLLLASGTGSAQNLVPNPGFENVIAQPGAENQLNLATPWIPLDATPDLYHVGQTNNPIIPCDMVDIPANVGGYTQERLNGTGYAGIKIDFSSNYREYVSVPLATPLKNGELYRVSFYVHRADSARYACNYLGALLSNGRPIQSSGSGPIGFPANVESNFVISDNFNWTVVTGIYQASGGENYLTIGLFRGDADPLLIKQDFGTHFSNCSNFDNAAYYFVDDAEVRPVSEVVEIQGDTIICPNESTTLFANTNVPIWWSTSSAPNDTISTDPSISIVPVVPTKYYLNGIFKQDSVTVTIVPAPVVELGPDSTLCEGDTVKLDAFATDALEYTWSNGDSASFILVADSGTYSVEVINSGCATRDTIHFSGFIENPPIDLGIDSLFCWANGDTLTLDAGPASYYEWQPGGTTNRTLTVSSPGYYSVKVTRENGCPRKAYMEVLEVCVPVLFIPSAFTPDEDGINDEFRVYIDHVVSYNLRILNRFGQTIFYSEDSNEAWDGKFNGTPAPIGVYVYRLNYRGLNIEGDKLKESTWGTITLLR